MRPLSHGCGRGVKSALGVLGTLRGVLGKSCLEGSLGDIAGDIEDDGVFVAGGMEFAVDGREGAQEQVAGVGHDGGAARSDFVAGEELVEFAERAVDFNGGAEFSSFTDETCGDGGFRLVLALGSSVVLAEATTRFRNEHAAVTATGGAMLTLLDFRRSGAGEDGFVVHGVSFRGSGKERSFDSRCSLPSAALRAGRTRILVGCLVP